MNDEELLAYVWMSAALLDLPLDAARAGRVAQQLARTAALAKLLESAPLAPEDEPAELYRPAPFPQAIDASGAP